MHALRVLRFVFMAALDEELLDGDPTAGVHVPRVDDSRETWTWLRRHEIELVERYEDEEARLIWTLALYTGLHKGELAGLRWADVRLEERYPHLVVQPSYRLATKSGELREVSLPPLALAAVRR